MTDNEIIKALECCKKSDATGRCDGCSLWSKQNCMRFLFKKTLNLINRQKAEIEELAYKLECLLCYATGGKLSKHTYPLNIMESYVNDTIQDYCEEAEAEAIKEFAERLCNGRVSNDPVVIAAKCELKEMVGDNNANE